MPGVGEGITIVGGPTDTVILRGLTINGAGVGYNGIQDVGSGQLHVENCTISNFRYSGIAFGPRPNSSGMLFVRNVSLQNNGDSAVSIQPQGSAVALLDNVTM